MKKLLDRAIPHAIKTLKNGFGAWLFVAKMTIPAMIITRLMLYFDLIPYVAKIFEPIVHLTGLPPEASLILVGGMVGNLYVALAVFLSLMNVMVPLTLIQATTLGAMCLVAHSLIVEGQVCKATGLSFWRVTIFRIVSSIILGILIHQSGQLFPWGSEPAAMMVGVMEFSADPVPPWLQWGLDCVKQLLMMLALVEVLMLFMELIKASGLTRLVSKVLGPVLKLAGVGESAVMVTIIGCVVGLSFGGGLIVAESRSGNIPPRDIYGAMMLMAAFHSLFEDTALMWLLGGSLWGLVGARLAFAMILVGLVTRLARRPAWQPVLVGKGLKFVEDPAK